MQIIELESAPSTYPGPLFPSKKLNSHSSLAAASKKTERACDFCRKRKTRCDGPWSKGNICSNCKSSKLQCTYVQESKPRGPPKSYVTSLEDRVERTEQYLRKLSPEFDLLSDLGPQIPRGSWKNDTPAQSPDSLVKAFNLPRASRSPEFNVPLRPGITNENELKKSSSPPAIGVNTPRRLTPFDDSDNEDTASEGSLDRNTNGRYFGKSGPAALIKATLAVKKEYDPDGIDLNFTGTYVPEDNELRNMQEILPRRPYTFPAPDLCQELIDIYFEQVNPHFPLFHQPTFQSQYDSSLHNRDRGFGALLLVLFAVASRWSDDPRVLSSPNAPKMSSGWRFFLDCQKYRPAALAPPSLFDLQRISLFSTFLRWTRHAPAAWSQVALGIRLAQDTGVHRKTRYSSTPSVEDELWKRAFWLLVIYDRLGSATLGRPCCSREEDFDLDLPLEVDDEHWIHSDPELAFKQPPEKPSRISYFNSFIKLTQMMAFALRTIYCIDKTKVLLGLVGPTWREQVMGQLKTAMDDWMESVPPFLRWGPGLDPAFASNSATLYTTFHLLTCLIYRPFLPPPNASRPPGKFVPTHEYPFPAMEACVTAARENVLILRDRMSAGSSNVANMIAVAHLCAAQLLMHIWQLKRADKHADVSDLIADVKLCLKALSLCQERWESAKIFFESLRKALPDEDGCAKSKAAGKSGGPPPSRQVTASPPAKPPMPPGSTDHPHERAMQPPQLTDGWHWFSQIGIGPSYANIPQDQPEERLQNRLASDWQPPRDGSEYSGLPHYESTLCSQSYTRSTAEDPMPSYMSSNDSGGLLPAVLTVNGQLPWWVGQAVSRQPAFMQTGSYENQQAGTYAQPNWQQTQAYTPPGLKAARYNLGGDYLRSYETAAQDTRVLGNVHGQPPFATSYNDFNNK